MKLLLLLLMAATVVYGRWLHHDYSAEVSRTISDSIKNKMYRLILVQHRQQSTLLQSNICERAGQRSEQS